MTGSLRPSSRRWRALEGQPFRLEPFRAPPVLPSEPGHLSENPLELSGEHDVPNVDPEKSQTDLFCAICAELEKPSAELVPSSQHIIDVGTTDDLS
jgi:hypothetical protein